MRSKLGSYNLNESQLMDKVTADGKYRQRHPPKPLLPEIFLKNLNESNYDETDNQNISISEFSKKDAKYVSNAHRNLVQNRVFDLGPKSLSKTINSNADSSMMAKGSVEGYGKTSNYENSIVDDPQRQTPRKRAVAHFRPPKASFYDDNCGIDNDSFLPDDSYSMVNTPLKNAASHMHHKNRSFHTPIMSNLNNNHSIYSNRNEPSTPGDDYYHTPIKSNLSMSYIKTETPRQAFNRSFIADDGRFDNSSEWVTVFGFNYKSDYNKVYNYMQQFGNIIECVRSNKCNYMHLRYFDATQAKKVLKKGHIRISETLIIGVTTCSNKSVPEAIENKSSTKTGILSKLYSFIGGDDM